MVLTQQYDKVSRRTGLSATINGTADFVNAYAWDGLSRMTQVTQTGQSGGNAVADKRVNFAYNLGGQFTTIDRYADLAGNQLVVQTGNTYDPVNKLLSGLRHADALDATLANYTWTYDALARGTSFTSPDGTSNYNYDRTDQLTSADHSYQDDEDYGYDLTGNRTNGGYKTDANNRLVSDGTFAYGYDAEGNRTSRTRISSAAASDYLTEYAWDHRNRLTHVTFENNAGTVTKTVKYTYDAFDRRIAKQVDDNGDGGRSQNSNAIGTRKMSLEN